VKIAVIPARGGSKRIPRKNIKLFCGKPMIAWSIEAAKSSGLFEHVIVSTDDAEIALKNYPMTTLELHPLSPMQHNGLWIKGLI
jgi:CMP-N-acetylneuraminic acid synthetase